MATDFFDEDLLKSPRLNRTDKIQSASSPLTTPSFKTASDISKPKFVRQKEEITTHVAGAITEIERLRQKQEALEREKRELEALARKQDEYETGKREIMEKLERSIMILQREDEQTHRLLELLSETIARFKTTLEELKEINEENWSEENFKAELEKASVRVEIATATYKKAMAKIEAMIPTKINAELPVASFNGKGAANYFRMSFVEWLKAGFAFFVPLALLIVILFVIYLFLNNFTF